MVVIFVYSLGDQIAGGARRDEWHVQARRPGLECQGDFAKIAADYCDHLVLAYRALSSRRPPNVWPLQSGALHPISAKVVGMIT